MNREDQVFPILACFHFSVPLSICEDRLCEKSQGWETTERVPGQIRVMRTTRRTWDEDNCIENDFIYPKSGKRNANGTAEKKRILDQWKCCISTSVLLFWHRIEFMRRKSSSENMRCTVGPQEREAEIMQMNRSREEIALQDPTRNDAGQKFVCFTLTRSWWSLLLS